ncbi:MAG TPA: hypothetical protein VHV31_11315, partial [Nitrolancea sp.]|nr:hypothetical protein [Nitrolancea sp.]
ILDDLTPLHQLRDGLAESDVVLFQPRPTVRMRTYGGGAGHNTGPGLVDYSRADTSLVSIDTVRGPHGEIEHHFLDAGQNPPDGVVIHYYLKEESSDAIRLSIRDNAGHQLRTFASDADSLPARAGLNRFVWNMRVAGAPDVTDATLDTWERPDGPRVLPGIYEVQLTIGDRTEAQRFEIIADRRIRTTREQLAEQFDFLNEVLGALSETNALISSIGTLRSQLSAWDERGISTSTASDIAAAREALNEIRGKLIDVNFWQSQLWPSGLHEKFNALFESVDSADYAPPAQARDVFVKLVAELNDLDERIGSVLNGQLPPLNRAIEQAGLPAIGLPAS